MIGDVAGWSADRDVVGSELVIGGAGGAGGATAKGGCCDVAIRDVVGAGVGVAGGA